MVLLMVGIGGVTRLSKAGLSITEWNPIIGILPPLSEQDWLQERLKYEVTPEYKVFNYNISTEEFRIIYLIEYIHRLVARITGLAFALPFTYFLLKKRISKKAVIRLSIVLLLMVLQALAGWYMVKSGLVSEPNISHYRLALHLLLALAIFALLSYQFFDYQIYTKMSCTQLYKQCDIRVIFAKGGTTSVSRHWNLENLILNQYINRLHNKSWISVPSIEMKQVTVQFIFKGRHKYSHVSYTHVTGFRFTNYSTYCTILILILIAMQIAFGAFVAGLNAGLIYNTFPLMNKRIVPENLFSLQPIWTNFFENVVTVQFIHRVLALLILVLTIILTIKNISTKPVYVMLLSVIIQITLGTVTLLLHVPTSVAIAHQMFSFILFGSGIYFLCYLRKQITSPTCILFPS
ncbi:COX15/CtaA family protein [Wolbachia endosymbiont of Cruorifilaria tuberocauda]|uniref:COX15/CtaA family protein n=1 Tax=Wolbachia endosymbiont of Cruorifilaria tuberocauda TaxID=1812111 RepID=UPI001FE688CD